MSYYTKELNGSLYLILLKISVLVDQNNLSKTYIFEKFGCNKSGCDLVD